MSEKTTAFIQRADAQINLANQQLEQGVTLGEVSASFMYGSARFSTYMACTSFENSEDMVEAKDEIIEYFLKEYKLALEEHLNNHAVTYDFSQNQQN